MRLRQSRLDRPGLRRVRRGKGFSYLDADGAAVDAATRERIASLAIPPAWRDVWICPYPNGHIQAVGTDDAGRRQYLYHEAWRLARDEAKHERVVRLARRLPRVREEIEADLGRDGLGCERVLAVALRMLDYGMFRTGGEEYVEEHGTHGVSTLLRDHARVRSGEVLLEFTAKGGIERTARLRDAPLAAAVSALRRSRSGSDRLLVYRCADGWRQVHAEDVNARFKELAGEDFTVKDLRTWQATVVAAVAFGQVDPPPSGAARKRAERAVMERVSEELGNTPAVARGSYVDPRVVDKFGEGVTIARALKRIGSDDLTDPVTRLSVERAVIRMLPNAGRR